MQPEFASLVAGMRRFAGSIRWLHVPASVSIRPVPGLTSLTKEKGSMPVALRSATFAVAAVALLGTAATGHAQEPIRIGVLQPMTGPATKNGTENYTAMQIARDMINERGGVNGRKVDFLLADIPTPT